MFITFEGGEGVGKSIQSKLLFEYLTSTGRKAITTREPGGTPTAENIRTLLLTGDSGKIEPLSESLLYLAARAEHWLRKIKPALNSGITVICDRFQDSSIVYQGMCKGVDIRLLNSIFIEFTNGESPKRTYLIDLDPEIGISRALARKNNEETRFEKMNMDFHKKVREGFLRLSRQDPRRFLTIDGSLSIQEIHKLIVADIKNLIDVN
ncbi:MAG: dTMP kinase [Holosporales bacterium]|jgi:dTMP kinase|nr:dTMP kinase [Holosporales bacterium]